MMMMMMMILIINLKNDRKMTGSG
jgi:hypothetical protein